jgi:prepilin-type N-terminal cleavage/methylation domain-containing protein
MSTVVSQDGFSLIEVLVALLIFALVAAGLAETLAVAQMTRHTSALRMEASLLAAAETERARARGATDGTTKVGALTCSTAVEALGDYPDLARVRVTVDWIDRAPRRLELVTLMSTAREHE